MIWVVGIGLGIIIVQLFIISSDLGRVITNTYKTNRLIDEFRYAIKPYQPPEPH